MKKMTRVLAMVLFVASLATLTSCQKTNQKQIIGNWKCVSAAMYIDDEVYDMTENVEGMVWKFGKGGELIAEMTDGSTTITEKAQYIVNENTLIVTYIDEEETQVDKYTIQVLTSDKLVLEQTDEDGDYMLIEFTKI